MRDHPECVHGMVVAMNDASQKEKWATGQGRLSMLMIGPYHSTTSRPESRPIGKKYGNPIQISVIANPV